MPKSYELFLEAQCHHSFNDQVSMESLQYSDIGPRLSGALSFPWSPTASTSVPCPLSNQEIEHELY